MIVGNNNSNKEFQYPKSLNTNKMFHYPSPLEEPTVMKTRRGAAERATTKSKNDFNVASFKNDLLDGTDLLKSENSFRRRVHSTDLSPTRATDRFDQNENTMSIDNILEHVQEWKSEFGIVSEEEGDDEEEEEEEGQGGGGSRQGSELLEYNDDLYKQRTVAPVSPTSLTGTSRSSVYMNSHHHHHHGHGNNNNNKYDVARSLRKKGSGPPAAAATLLSAHSNHRASQQRRASSHASSTPHHQETPSLPVREIPERALSFSQLAARQRQCSFKELAAQKGVQW